jgi:lipopolysaccharide export LptBFGC system permease protein LptF
MTEERKGIGCLSFLLAINTLLIGAFTWSFVSGPYSSFEQELWYRYGSLAFFLIGVVLPGAALAMGTGRSETGFVTMFVAMPAILILFLLLSVFSSGGV